MKTNDILDSKTYKLLNRSYVVWPLLRNSFFKVRAERVQAAIEPRLKDQRAQ